MSIENQLKDIEQDVINLRRWFHMHPEVSFNEENTSKKIQEELDKIGIPYESNFQNSLRPNEKEYSIIATIEGMLSSNKKLGIRADFDGLPIKEETGLPFCSINEGIMHACGHDAHAAMLLGVAKILWNNKDKIAGTVKLLFQAAEEVGGESGVKPIIDELETTGGIDNVIGIHIWSAIPSGQIVLKNETIFAGCGSIKYLITGKGGHGARPDLVHDPIKAGCDLVNNLSRIPSNFYNVLDNSVVAICQFESGSLGNIFPTTAKLRGGFRYFTPGGEVDLRNAIRRVAQATELLHNVKIEVIENAEEEGLTPIYNTPELIEPARKLIENIDGLELSPQNTPISASDNFCKLIDKYPGFYAILGAAKPDEEIYPQHNSKFDINEKVLIKGCEFLVKYALNYFL
ncbi:MAG: hypothetical protein ATN31_06640 [Candidatus Epulonipiscioides saccharophilum]|nr:MAG: hypothetical protein ATN31_06640 [Epulopiscium sp. AS2M-Bin001]